MTALPLQLHISDCHALGPNIGLLKTHRIELRKEVETRIATVISLSYNFRCEKMRASLKAIICVMQLYFRGNPGQYPEISKCAGLEPVNHVTIQGWIKKYVRLMEGNLEKINLKHHTGGNCCNCN